MSHGPSRSLFTQLASNDHTLIVLTERGQPGTLSHDLFQAWNSRQADGCKAGEGSAGRPLEMNDKFEVKVRAVCALYLRRGPSLTTTLLASQVNLKVPLSGQELADFNEAKLAETEKEAAQKAALARTQQLLEADEVESDDDEDEDGGDLGDDDPDELGGRQRGQAGGDGWADDTRQLSFDIYVKGQATRAASFFKSATGSAPRFRMFPFVEKRARNVDQYGEAVDVGIWLRKGKEIEEIGEDEFVKEAKRRRIEEEQKKVRLTRPSRLPRIWR